MGGTICLIIIQKFTEDYKEIVLTPIFRPTTLTMVLHIIWAMLVASNAVWLSFLLYRQPPRAQTIQMDNGAYVEMCNLNSWYYLSLPATIGIIYVYAIIIKLLNSLISTAVARQNSDILNSIVISLTFIAILVGVMLVIFFVTTPTQKLLIVSAVLVTAGLSTPVNLLFWLGKNNNTTKSDRLSVRTPLVSPSGSTRQINVAADLS